MSEMSDWELGQQEYNSVEVLVIAHKRIYALEMQVAGLKHVAGAARAVCDSAKPMYGYEERWLEIDGAVHDALTAVLDVLDKGKEKEVGDGNTVTGTSK